MHHPGFGADESGDHGAELIVVLETNDRIHLAMAKGLLEDAGIPFFVQGQIATLVQDVDGFLHKWVRLQVSRDFEEEAREVLEQLEQPLPEDSDEPTMGFGPRDPHSR